MDQPDIRPVREKDELYVLNEDFTYMGITAKKGFRYDGATVPKFLWFLFPRDGMHRAAVLIHDWIYHFNGELPDGTQKTRKQADDIFYRMMKDYKITSWKSKAAYRIIRLIGGFWWR